MSTKKPSFRAAILVAPACLDDLPDELLLEVLARVPATTSIFPAKAAARLRAVSRRWNSVISSADYILRFISLGEENNCPWGNGEALLFMDKSKSVPLFYMLPSQCNPTVFDQPALDFSYISDDYVVISSSEDLLLLRALPQSKKGPLVVCNPFTKRWVGLPNPPDADSNFVLVCEPQGRRYRVVSTKWDECECEDVFVSERGEWKEALLKREAHCTSNILPLHGKLYWYSYDGKIVSYDPFEESFRIFLQPGSISESEYTEYGFHECYLFVVHGSLWMLWFSLLLPHIGEEEEFNDLIAWELDYKQERWSLVNKSSLRIDNSGDGPDPPFAVHPDGDIVYLRTTYQGLAFHDLTQGCSNLSKVLVKEELDHCYDAFLLTRPWRPSSVCYGSSR